MVNLASQWNSDLLTVLGLIGFLGYMVSYGLVQGGRLDGNGISYTLLNLVSAALVLVSLITAFNLASALTQVTWIVVSAAGLVRHVQRRAQQHRDRGDPRVWPRTRWLVASLALVTSGAALVTVGLALDTAPVSASRGVTGVSVPVPTAVVASVDTAPRWADVVPAPNSSERPRGTRFAAALSIPESTLPGIDHAHHPLGQD